MITLECQKNAHPGVGTDRKKCAEKNGNARQSDGKTKKEKKNVPK
jgi:hypothetical protein